LDNTGNASSSHDIKGLARKAPTIPTTEIDSLEVFYRDYADWIADQDDDREMLKIEAPIASNIPRISLAH